MSRRLVTGLGGVRENICGQVAEIEIQVAQRATPLTFCEKLAEYCWLVR